MKLLPLKINIIDVMYILYVVSIVLFSHGDKRYISNLIFVGFVFICIFRIMTDYRGRIVYHDIKFFLPITVFAWVTVPMAMDAQLALSKAITISFLLFFTVLLFNIYRNQNKCYVFLVAIMLGGLLLALKVISFYGFELIVTRFKEGLRVGREILQLNQLGRYMVYSTMASLFFAYYMKKYICYIPAVLCGFVCLVSASRGSLFALMCGMALLFLFKYGLKLNTVKGMTRLTLLTVFLLVSVCVIIQIPAFSGIVKRIMDGMLAIVGKSSLVSDAKRVNMIKLGFQVFGENPVIGIGLGNIHCITTGILSHYQGLHNTYVELLATGGIIGFLCWYSIYTVCFWRVLNGKIDKYQMFGVILLIVQLVIDITDVTYASKMQYIIFAYAFIASSDFGCMKSKRCVYKTEHLYGRGIFR